MTLDRAGRPATPMRQWPDEGDRRNKGFCAHCGGPEETRDHNPSKVFLDIPLPPNLPVASSCAACNSGFSDDEEYLACLVECVLAGEVEPSLIERSSVAKTLAGNRRLQRELAQCRREHDGQILWNPDAVRVSRIAEKLARGLVDYELNEPQLHAPDLTSSRPLMLMAYGELRAFEGEPGGLAFWPEIGSRAFHRLLLGGNDEFENGWIVVQQDRFRYRVTQESGIWVRMVLREYLAMEIAWL